MFHKVAHPSPFVWSTLTPWAVKAKSIRPWALSLSVLIQAPERTRHCFNSCGNFVVTTVVPAVLKEAVRRVGSCLKVKRHFREATSHNFAALSLEQVMAKLVSGENWTA
jgi:hypothetical protein